jgi:2-polyprenyl-3-methyl-5-hydroxy-6-metoxy-1,4-benzoquinol methylase
MEILQRNDVAASSPDTSRHQEARASTVRQFSERLRIMAKQVAPLTSDSQKTSVSVERYSWRTVRRRIGAIPGARSAYGLFCALRDCQRWGSDDRLDRWLHNIYAEHVDPWNYTESDEQARFQSAAELLDRARGEAKFREALEVGCAEGHFTSQLMLRCESLLSVDISQVAMGRARERCPDNIVRFEVLDLRREPLPGNFDLVVVMDVLELFYRPAVFRRIRPKLASAVKPGGYLLVGNSRQNRSFEDSWWAKFLIRGGKQINRFIGAAPNLSLVSESGNDMFINTLLRRI